MTEKKLPDQLIDQLKEANKASKKSLPPVHLWHPDFCGDIDIRIARNGSWYYLGTPINRHAMVRLFSTVLRYDDDNHYYLVTPVEKLRIKVDDVPFVASLKRIEGIGENQKLVFLTNVGDEVIAGKSNPIRVAIDKKSQEPSPYLLVRTNLEALISRSSFYELVDIAVASKHSEDEQLGVWSNNKYFVFDTTLN